MAQTKEKKQNRFAGAQLRANKRDRKCDLDPEANLRDKRVVEHRASCPLRNKLISRFLGREVVTDRDVVIDLSDDDRPNDLDIESAEIWATI